MTHPDTPLTPQNTHLALRILTTAKKHWFLIGLIAVFALVIFDWTGTLARAGILFKDNNGPSVMIFVIFLLSGMIIEVEQIRAGIRDVRATCAALGMIVLVSPVLALLLVLIPMETGMALGLFLVAVMPTTLSSGVVMTGQARGNMAHALFVTILSNCIAVGTIPVVLPLLLAGLDLDAGLFIDRAGIFITLLFLVLLPLVMGMGIKKAVPDMPLEWKKRFSMVNQCIVLGIVYMSLSGAREALVAGWGDLFIVLPLVVGFHLALLAASFGAARLLHIGRGRRESVIFMGAQKTLPLSVMLQITCFPQYGIALLVCVIHHIAHLMIDGFLAGKMGSE